MVKAHTKCTVWSHLNALNGNVGYGGSPGRKVTSSTASVTFSTLDLRHLQAIFWRNKVVLDLCAHQFLVTITRSNNRMNWSLTAARWCNSAPKAFNTSTLFPQSSKLDFESPQPALVVHWLNLPCFTHSSADSSWRDTNIPFDKYPILLEDCWFLLLSIYKYLVRLC